MITEIHMEAVASFKHATSLLTDKKINLIYGLNGTGKSTVSDFLYDPIDSKFAQCKKEPESTPPILVYNQTFIQDNFYVADNLKGIFSLSKENKAAEEKIAKATKRKDELEESLQTKYDVRENITQEFEDQKKKAVNEVWKIKTTYTGGDRVLEYCLDGLKGQKEKLFFHLQEISKPSIEPERDIQTLRKDVEALKGDTAQPHQRLSPLLFSAHDVESDEIFGTSILGNTDSEVAALIEKLGNSDWVKQGLSYLPENVEAYGGPCPFCQENTISLKFIESVKGYFDASYQKKMDALETLNSRYASEISRLPDVSDYTNHPFAKDHKTELHDAYHAVIERLRSNAERIEKKKSTPKTPVQLEDTSTAVANFNAEVATVNAAIDHYNERLKNRDKALATIRDEFWRLMRWQYDQTISRFETDQQAANQRLKDLDRDISKINSDIAEIRKEIAAARKETVNVEEAVDAINAGLLDLGIDDFEVSKHSDNLYRVVRAGDSKDAFHTLSEGEKMMISFLYFCELCKGQTTVDDTHTRRIAVIDDPISSLSHVFIFNVGQLIKSVFFRGERFSQVFVLTHSLYFFYELTDPNHERRKETQSLFRITKPASGSCIQEMKYEEIQNDYQAYWSVVNDPDQPPALVANCMRNIVEYFFGFVQKKNLNNVFQMPELQDVRFQAFYRYINRESHSLGQNLIDMKEFDYDVFKEGLRLVFEKAGYPEHFEAMSKD